MDTYMPKDKIKWGIIGIGAMEDSFNF